MEESDEKIAVIAVHGVAYHAPGQSAREVSNLLATLRMSDKDSLCYTPFTERSLRLPVREIDSELTHEGARQEGETEDIEFTRKLLQDYKVSGKEAVYETVCIKGHRVLDSEKHQSIDVYELYWNDLSRISTNFFGVFSSFYNLLFHLCDIGKQSIEFAKGSPRWISQIDVAHRLLTFIVPFINIVIIVLLLGMIPLSYNGIISKVLVVLFFSFIPVLICYFISSKLLLSRIKSNNEDEDKHEMRSGNRSIIVFWGSFSLILFLIFGIGCSFIFWGMSGIATPTSLYLGTCVGGIIAFSGLYYVGKRFEIERGVNIKMVYWFTIVPIVILVSSIMYCYYNVKGHIADIISAGFLTAILIVIGVLILTWIVQVVYSIYIIFRIGKGNFVTSANNESKLLQSRAIDTLRITTLVPMALFLYLALSIWIGIAGASPRLYQGLCVYPNANRIIGFVYHWIHAGSDIPSSVVVPVSSFITDCIKCAVGKLYGYGVVALFACAIPALWAFGSSILDELKPPRYDAKVDEAKQQKQADDICHQGNWLNGGFKVLTVAGGLVFIAILCYVVGFWLGPFSSGLNLQENSSTSTAAGAGGLAGIGVVLALLNRFNKTFSSLGSIVGVAVDVDNHLKERPQGRTPRARMAARGASLLRYLEREGYTRVVIVAHSQGTVLMADLLRFLVNRRGVLKKAEPALHQMLSDTATDKKCEISFMTMGSPLRQLYYLRFPHLYGWVEKPEPALLGVTEWVNFYRAGDYVGRGVWRDNDSNTWTYGFDMALKRNPTTETKEGVTKVMPGFREFCLGQGAHTHYWDDTAPEVAHTLDLLITRGRRLESAPQTLEKMSRSGDASPEEEQRLKNMGILEGEICKLFSTAPGTVPPSDLPTRLNEAAQQVEQIVETLDGAVQELSALVQEQKGYGASFIKSASVAS